MVNVYNNKLSDLISKTAQLYGDWLSGTVDSGSTTTVVDDERPEADDYFQNTTPVSVVRIYETTDGAAPVGESSRITDFVNASGTITVSGDKPFTVAPGAGDKYAIMHELSWAEVKWAINMAIDMIKQDALEPLLDETTITIEDSTYEYALPTGLVWLTSVSQADDNGDFPYVVPPDEYKIIHGVTPKLHFIRFPVESQGDMVYYSSNWISVRASAGKVVRIEGFTIPHSLDNDYDTTTVSPSFLVFQAAALLHSKRIADPRYDSAYHKARADTCTALANIERSRLELPQLPPDAKRCRD